MFGFIFLALTRGCPSDDALARFWMILSTTPLFHWDSAAVVCMVIPRWSATVGIFTTIVCEEFLGSAIDSYPHRKDKFDDGFPVSISDKYSSR